MNIEEKTNKETILNILMYLFENHMQNDCQIDLDQNLLSFELNQIGFDNESICKAFCWLSELFLKQYDMQKYPPQKNSIRIFDKDECLKLDKLCRNLIMKLESVEILHPLTRELVISQIMQLDVDAVSINQLKWVILMILFNQPNKGGVLDYMENLIGLDILDKVQKI